MAFTLYRSCRSTDLAAACLVVRGSISYAQEGNTEGDSGYECCWREVVSTRRLSASSGLQTTPMAQSKDFRGTQEIKEPSKCLGPSGGSGRAWTRWRASWKRQFGEREKCCRSESRTNGLQRGAGRGAWVGGRRVCFVATRQPARRVANLICLVCRVVLII